ncbi:alpha-L-rhamnosidase C-terminal domain-containing protein [Actinoallomurus iriomotensis]|uniref:Alpha-L-rhamnosidase n=1 Tax=Actinoallomurus iriomotensis TaxID=478107 RepID=A0A9W6RVX4_9ACTN|nr:alpha-L-rhamnosidase C-terminal domain-containing protein [Actinoallomurus iriomotensis]GLY82529.1 hypothetical protein Airi02_004610 [Actinoallomurus iriomotensis]
MRKSRALAVAALVAAGLAVPAVPAAATGDDPWHASSYTPHHGDWRPYVLAPSGHTVRPVSVLKTVARQGRVEGDPRNALKADGRSVRLVGAADRAGSPLLILDFGKEVAGRVTVRGTGTGRLHACFSESRRYLAEDPADNDGEGKIAPGCDTANIWNGFPGVAYTEDTDSHELTLNTPDRQVRGGFRYLTLFLDGPGQVDVDAVSAEFTAAPLQPRPDAYQGHFLSSDDLLNKIWYAGAYTVQINTALADTAKSWPYTSGEQDHADTAVPYADPDQEVIYDGGKRDRIVWQGDLAVQAPVTYLTTHDVAAVDNSLSSLAAQQLPDGFMPAESQAGQHNKDELRTYGEYVTWFVNNMYEHWLYTGDRAYLDKWWPALTRTMSWLESVRAQDPQGLIAFGAVGSCGHYGYSDCGHETYVNALYARNLTQMAELARARGESGAAYADRAAAVRKAVNDQLWDENAGAYRMSREIPDAYPQDANATAVLTGVADATRAGRSLAYLRAHNWSSLGSLTVGTANASLSPFYAPLPSGFEADARLGTGDTSGLDLIKKFWGWQLAQDPGSTFWEHVQPDGTPNLKQFSSLAHGWASAPTTILTTRVLGVQPTAAGFASYAVVPHTGDLKWAEGTVPTPKGNITASWRNTGHGFRLEVTAHATGRLGLPAAGRVTLDGHVVWADGRATAKGVTGEGGYVYVDGVAPGHHTLESR